MTSNDKIEAAELSGTRVRHRLGIVGWPGFAPVPHLLMLHQHELKLTSPELNVYLNIFMHWHDAGRFPFPRTATIAARMGTTPRRVRQVVKSLIDKGMVEKISGVRRGDPKCYDVRPLLMKLERRAKEWAALKNQGRPIHHQTVSLNLLSQEL